VLYPAGNKEFAAKEAIIQCLRGNTFFVYALAVASKRFAGNFPTGYNKTIKPSCAASARLGGFVR